MSGNVTYINCPNCQAPINVDDWFEGYAKTDDGLYYFTCKGCQTKLGSTYMLDCTVSIWNKKDEKV